MTGCKTTRSPGNRNTSAWPRIGELYTFLGVMLLGAYCLSATRVQADETRLNGQTFTLPAGFEISLAAAPPLSSRPITASFDEQGRLYVAESSGSNENVRIQLEKKPHSILRLEDTDGDGVFDKRVVFAEGMMFPEGTLWYDGSLYVAAPPSIWKLTDTDDDGVADVREEWFEGKTLTGCANDLHGPYLGPDGWIYWCKGAFAEQRYPRPGREDFVTRASHIFRCRPDGTGIEPVMTGGMDNPVDCIFMPTGERIFSTTFLQHPGGGKRDGLIHAVYGGVYGKVHGVLDGHPRTGDIMPVLVHLGAAAPCGLERTESARLGNDYRHNVFACSFNMHKVTRHALERDGGTFTTQDSDFLVSDSLDFHPTDILEDADGSLLVVDTGGWYKLCCPTSQIQKPDVLGAIYRIRRTGVPDVADPRGRQLNWENPSTNELSARLNDRRHAVRRRATEQLADRGEQTVSFLARLVRQAPRAETRAALVWTLTRIETPEARAAVRQALYDSEEMVRLVALHCVSLHRDTEAVPALLELLENGSPAVQRAAAEALGRIGNPQAVPSILAVSGQPHDRFVEHSLIYALQEIGRRDAIRAGLQVQNTGIQRAAAIALDQLADTAVTPELMSTWLTGSDESLKETATWIVQHHPEWGGPLVSWFEQRLTEPMMTPEELRELGSQLQLFANDADVREMLATAAIDPNIPVSARLQALAAMSDSGQKDLPVSWKIAFSHLLRSSNSDILSATVAAVRQLANPKLADAELNDALFAVARNDQLPAETRVNALAAISGPSIAIDNELFAFLSQNFDSSRPVSLRMGSADVLARAQLDNDQRRALTDVMRIAGPLELTTLLSIFEKQTDEQLGLALVAALRDSTGSASLRGDRLQASLASFPQSVQSQGEELLKRLNVDLAQQKAYLAELEATLPAGDQRRGQLVFNGTKAACSTCHAIGYLGGRIGPDLTNVGKIRTKRDLLESVVYPSASFVRSYEPMTVVTVDGRVFSGLLQENAGDFVVLVSRPDKQERIARSDIEEMLPANVSVMPAGMDKNLTRQELADLLEFLKESRR